MSKLYCSCGAIIDDGFPGQMLPQINECPNSNIFNRYKHKLTLSVPSEEKIERIKPKIIGRWK